MPDKMNRGEASLDDQLCTALLQRVQDISKGEIDDAKGY